MLHAHHEVHALESRNRVGLQLGIATHHHYERTRVLARKAVNRLAALGVGSVGHATRIDDTQVRYFALSRHRHATQAQCVLKRSHLGKIEFAAQSMEGCFFI